jgi:hypothetical protein
MLVAGAVVVVEVERQIEQTVTSSVSTPVMREPVPEQRALVTGGLLAAVPERRSLFRDRVVAHQSESAPSL